ncbi:PQQ-like beta-propeller repeat protein [Spiractinospora alimapuensis]|uniref:outer membrane protein assembly factor BamB family protein n=1 Tax=Spiractinospora alimapuensis TaxID=2820884 RepID=UPI001F2C7781|nr:PQQ-binding-like beta-propeller repeat protein [Spiractinospora alimapuensis]QVQ51217.1 PQQ-like beta-propeller repeat protein [Spiractinospora alimapuensis]
MGVLALSGCGVVGGEGELDIYALEPNEISPDELVTCEGEECEEPGALRWSLPLDGEYVVPFEYDEYTAMLPIETLEFTSGPIMTHRDGVVFLGERDILMAVDANTGERLWRESMESEHLRSIERLHVTDAGVLVSGNRPQGEGRGMVLIDVESGTGLNTFDDEWRSAWVQRVDGNRVLLSAGADLYMMGDAESGEILWSAEVDEDERIISGPLDGVLYAADNPGRSGTTILSSLSRIDGETGQGLGRVDLSDEARAPRPARSFTGTQEVILSRLECDVEKCEPGGMSVVDGETGELLWDSRPFAFDVAEEDGRWLVNLREGDDVRMVDARTGEAVREDTPDAMENVGRLRTELEYPDGYGDPRRQVALRFPGQDATAWDGDVIGPELLSPGIDSENGPIAMVYGCAPDGLEPEPSDTSRPGSLCVKPRLFAIGS